MKLSLFIIAFVSGFLVGASVFMLITPKPKTETKIIRVRCLEHMGANESIDSLKFEL